jgi:phenylacetic acid degradation operon negative regulatory protein
MRDTVVQPEAGAAALLLTLLGEFVLPAAEPVWTSTFTDAFATLRVEEKAARQALARSSRRDLLAGEKVGRRVRWALTPQAQALLREGTRRIYRFGLDAPPWDGRWLLVFCSLPESRRELRYRLRVRLGWAGLAPLGAGAWISPWTDREAGAVTVLRELAVDAEARTFCGSLGSLGDPRDIAAQAWELDRLAAAYDEFLAAARADAALLDDHPPGEEAAFVALTHLVHRWRQFPALDPELPDELLPDRWPAPQAVRCFHRLHAAWTGPATEWWHRLDQR